MRYRRSSRVWRSSRPPSWLPTPAIHPVSRLKQRIALFSLFTFIVVVLLLIHTVGYRHGRHRFGEPWWNWNRTLPFSSQNFNSTDDLEYSKFHLPLRYIQPETNETIRKRSTSLLTCSHNPFSSCRRLGHPEICCPDPLLCMPQHSTSSKIFCCQGRTCNAPVLMSNCPWNYHECPVAYGGGCCHYSQRCAREGCEELRHPELNNVTLDHSGHQEVLNTAPIVTVDDAAGTFLSTVLPAGDPITGPQSPATGIPRGFRGWREKDIPLSQRMGLVPTKTTIKFGEIVATGGISEPIVENGTLRIGFLWDWAIISLGALAVVMFAL